MSEAVCDPVAQQLAAMCRAHVTSSICVNCAVLNRALLSSACAHAHFAWYSFASTADTAISCGQDKRAEYLQKVIDLSPEIYGSYARDNANCLPAKATGWLAVFCVAIVNKTIFVFAQCCFGHFCSSLFLDVWQSLVQPRSLRNLDADWCVLRVWFNRRSCRPARCSS